MSRLAPIWLLVLEEDNRTLLVIVFHVAFVM